MTRYTFALTLSALSMSTPALADQVFSDDVIVTGNLCVGSSDCVDGESFGEEGLKIKSTMPQLLFSDTNAGDDQWRIGSLSTHYTVRNDTTGRDVIRLDADAMENALFVTDNGRLGLGTSMPLDELHIAGGSTPGIVLEQTNTGAPYQWRILADDSGMALRDATANTTPFVIEAGTATSAIHLDSNGSVGVGTATPTGQLELSTDASFNFFRITALGATINKAVDITFTAGPLGTGQLRYNIVDGDNQEMSLDANGNMVIDGTLTTSGPTCAGGCDRVFDADYALPSIAERADQMFAAGHLPAIGVTVPHAPVNLSETLGAVINELEHAHIFIAQQNEALLRQANSLTAAHHRLSEQGKTIADLVARLDAQEAAVAE